MKRNIIIIGSTGSVGSSAIDIVYKNKDLFNVKALVAKNNYIKLAEQALQINSPTVILEDKTHYSNLKDLLSKTNINPLAGKEAIINLIKEDKDNSLIFIASSGTESIEYFQEALINNKNIAIANKESIVCFGDLLKKYLKTYIGKLIPVDSEHNSLFQIINLAEKKEISTVVITGSGGAFIDTPLNELKHIKKEKALIHPNWSMGSKITIDSATFMNKALEVIEAAYLFDINPKIIDVVIHRKSILHAGVNFVDGTFIGNFYSPSMNIPVAYAMHYPNRINTGIKNLSLAEVGSLHFEKLDENRFSSISMAKEVIKKGGNYPIVLNVANEIAVNCFLEDKINFTNIIDVVEFSLNNIQHKKISSLEEINEECKLTTIIVNEYIKRITQ